VGGVRAPMCGMIIPPLLLVRNFKWSREGQLHCYNRAYVDRRLLINIGLCLCVARIDNKKLNLKIAISRLTSMIAIISI